MNILLVKLGALGDVLRTTPLLSALKREHPSARVTWVVDERHADVLEGNAEIDELIRWKPSTPAELSRRRFDWAINLDKEPEALDSIEAAAKKKSGFGRGPQGQVVPLDPSSDYAVRLGVDDELKFRRNRKTYQEISFEQAGLPFRGEEYVLPIGEDERAAAREHLRGLGVDPGSCPRPLVGLNTGAGTRFAGKRLPTRTFTELARLFKKETAATVLLLGGTDELARNREIAAAAGVPVVQTGAHPIRRFAALVRECDVVLSSDSTAMHVAIATRVPVVAWFGSTCAPEIELYGRGVKIVSNLPCAPCYLKECPIGERCMEEIEPRVLFDAAFELLKATAKRSVWP